MNKEIIQLYLAPSVEVFELKIESGFASSSIGGITDDEDMGGGGGDVNPF